MTGKYRILHSFGLILLAAVPFFVLSLLLPPASRAAEPQAPTPKFVTDTASVTVPEGQNATFSVKLNKRPASPVIATVFWAGGDPDITVVSGATLAFDESNFREFQQVTLAAAEDGDTADGTATIRIRDTGSIIDDADVTAAESDNDTAISTVSFAAASSSGTESATPALLAVTLSPASTLSVTVDYAVTGGTATGGEDFTLSSGTLTFDPGVTTQTIDITIIDDLISEPNETVLVSLSSPSNASLGGTTTHTYTIIDNDGQPTVFFAAATQEGAENSGTMSVLVQLSFPSALPVTVPFTVSGTAATAEDFTLSPPGSMAIPAGSTTGTIVITVIDDAAVEGNETVVITMGTPENAFRGTPDEHTATIVDNDVPVTFVTDTGSVLVPEGGTSFFQVRLSGQPSSDVTASVSRADGDADISVISGNSLTFTPLTWDTFQAVVLAAEEDPDADNGTATIRVSHTGSVIPDADVTATEADNENNAITVTSPNGGESWAPGETHEVTWLSTGTTGPSVSIELLRRNSLDRIIIPNTPNDGSFTWTIPADLETGSDFRVRVTSLSDGAIIDESDGAFSIATAGPDTDNDGVPDTEEMGPAGDDPEYDGNQDGIIDSRQDSAASLHTFDGSHYVTLESPGGLSGVSVMGPPPDAPQDTMFPYGFFEFSLSGIGSGGAATVTIFTDGEPIQTYYKFGGTPDNFVPHWYEFSFNPETVTGAEINGFEITLHFVDGLVGDDDLAANGVITDQGGPAVSITSDSEATGSDCFIATAVYGSTSATSVLLLRQFRDRYLLTNLPGKWFVKNYYRYSPAVAKWLATRPIAKRIVRLTLTPMVVLSWLLLHSAIIFTTAAASAGLFTLIVIAGRRGKRKGR